MTSVASAKHGRIAALVDEAGLSGGITCVESVGIGTAGLNARGPRDEDGTHDRVGLSDGTSLIYREYARTTQAFAMYQAKETAVMRCLRDAGLPAPAVVASGEGGCLLSDGGGRPLEEVFREIGAGERPKLWSEVGALLRRLHELPVETASFLNSPMYRRPWTDFVPYLAKTVRHIKARHPDLAKSAGEFLALRPALQQWCESRPKSICCGNAGYFPGMLLARDADGWQCTTWLSLGYYVSITDPATDIVRVSVAHREWTGAELPPSFYRAYGSRPDPVAALLYEAWIQIGRGSAYIRPDSSVNKKGRAGPPPHSTAVDALLNLPATVEKLTALLR